MKACFVAMVPVCFAAAIMAGDEPHYIGVAKCAKMCHKAEAKGNQYGAWQKEKHSNAYKVLGTPEAKAVAQKAGITGDPQKADACLRCHVTAFGVKSELIDSTFKMEEGVQCETCHGPGSNYAKLTVMKDLEKSKAAGLIMPTKEVCVKCHNPESPSYKEFIFEERVKEISHPNPQKAAAK